MKIKDFKFISREPNGTVHASVEVRPSFYIKYTTQYVYLELAHWKWEKTEEYTPGREIETLYLESLMDKNGRT